jgi:hypothetical protein
MGELIRRKALSIPCNVTCEETYRAQNDKDSERAQFQQVKIGIKHLHY